MADDAKQIFVLMPKVMADIKAVGKTRDNQQQGYKFRGIDEVYEAVNPALVKHGVFVVPKVLNREREKGQTKNGGSLTYTILTVEHRFYAPDGSFVECVTVGEAMDSGDKSANKAMSAAMKYALIETFSIPVHEPVDTENQTHEPVAQSPATGQQAAKQTKAKPLATPQQLAEMKSFLGSIPDETLQKWFAKAGIEAWEQMPSDMIVKCIGWAKTNLAKMQGRAAA